MDKLRFELTGGTNSGNCESLRSTGGHFSQDDVLKRVKCEYEVSNMNAESK